MVALAHPREKLQRARQEIPSSPSQLSKDSALGVTFPSQVLLFVKIFPLAARCVVIWENPLEQAEAPLSWQGMLDENEIFYGKRQDMPGSVPFPLL